MLCLSSAVIQIFCVPMKLFDDKGKEKDCMVFEFLSESHPRFPAMVLIIAFMNS